ncbi:hypothetical protein GCM10009131_34650 [Morganella psychrotolerans]
MALVIGDISPMPALYNRSAAPYRALEFTPRYIPIRKPFNVVDKLTEILDKKKPMFCRKIISVYLCLNLPNLNFSDRIFFI